MWGSALYNVQCEGQHDLLQDPWKGEGPHYTRHTSSTWSRSNSKESRIWHFFFKWYNGELESVTRVKNCNNVVFCPELLCGPTTTSLMCCWMCYYVSNCCVDISETSESWNAITPDWLNHFLLTFWGHTKSLSKYRINHALNNCLIS